MNLKKYFFLTLISLGSINAQTFIAQKSLVPKNLEIKKTALSINILAVMVEFPPDKYNLTKGDGTFGTIYSKDYGTSIIDPLPHDKNYFEDHLQFAKNYYAKSSNGLVDVSYNVIPNIVTVSKFMREYSPVESESFKSLGDFSTEVWTLAAQQNPTLDFSQYNLFVIFHAGVGKDISTSTLLGEPRDLPSIYIGLNSFKEFYGESFDGIAVTNGTKITNSVILPETESREEEGFGGSVLIELSINGLLVSNIASYLGLPDLFDAETGKSAIGRFGLMDGQSLFAYGGLFPPEPSAWEKIFLGWEEPTTFEFNRENINIVPRLAYALNQDIYKIVKIPINSTEYYLIENRQRDVYNDGITVTYKVNGEVKTINFAEDTDEFNNAIVDTLSGVILDIDEFDWATPGNGILIWHIDEKIINENLAVNRINVGKNRGVDLEEADGIQDIGEEFQSIFGDIIIAEGDEFDYWYLGNTSKLYKNKFGIDTKPNTMTNSGANSLITISNFSSISNKMSFAVSFDSENIKFLASMEGFGAVQSFKLTDNIDPLKSFLVNESNLTINFASLLISNFSNVDFALIEYNNTELVVGAKDNILNLIQFGSDSNSFSSVEMEANSTSPILLQQSSDTEVDIYIGLSNGSINKYRYDLLNKAEPVKVETIPLFSTPVNQFSILDNELVAVSTDKIRFEGESEITFDFNIKQVTLSKTSSGKYLAVILAENNMISSFEKGVPVGKIILQNNFEIKSIALADIKNDGENYIVFNHANEIYAINLDGSSAENFPFTLNSESMFEGSPLAADINGDNYSDVISTTKDGNVYAVSGKTGKVISGFPISIGGTFSGIQSIVKRDNDLLLSAVTDQNYFYFWSINSTGKVDWGSEFGNNFNSLSLGLAASENFVSTFFPKNKTYNWPNPVYGNETFIRTYVAEDSKVEVKVFDLAGDLVDEFIFNAIGGLDSEVAWNVSKIQSGAYFAHLEVTSSSGKTDSKMIKIAIVK